jgi:hypothetical protein
MTMARRRPKEEEEGNKVISHEVAERNRGESLVSKKSVSRVPNFEEVTN